MQMIRIEQVTADSVAAEAGVAGGDILLAVDDRPIGDIVDYYLALADQTSVKLLVQRHDSEPFEVLLEVDEDEDPGLVPVHPEPASCGNNCIFCFVHQLPRGMRRTLYVKDEDYRFSWLYGAYITLANIREEELQRIVSDQLSPLYISVHAVDEQVRRRLLGKEVPPLLPLLQRLVDAGIELHTQVVLCPGVNDGQVLEQTITQLAQLWPGIRSLAIVPVGLTRHRQHLPQLEPVSADLAAHTLDQIEVQQDRQFHLRGSRFVFAADEFYLRAGRHFPSLETYEDLFQLENGVGLVPVFRREGEEALLDAVPLDLDKVSLVTGCSFAPELEQFAARLATRIGVKLQVVAVENRFFGERVTVTGLLTGADIIAAFADRDPGDAILLPEVLFNHGESLLLDDLRLEDLQRHFKVPVMCIRSDPWGILDGLERLDCREIEILDV